MCMTSEDCLKTMLWRFISENHVNNYYLCWDNVHTENDSNANIRLQNPYKNKAPEEF